MSHFQGRPQGTSVAKRRNDAEPELLCTWESRSIHDQQINHCPGQGNSSWKGSPAFSGSLVEPPILKQGLHLTTALYLINAD